MGLIIYSTGQARALYYASECHHQIQVLATAHIVLISTVRAWNTLQACSQCLGLLCRYTAQLQAWNNQGNKPQHDAQCKYRKPIMMHRNALSIGVQLSKGGVSTPVHVYRGACDHACRSVPRGFRVSRNLGLFRRPWTVAPCVCNCQ